MQCNVKIFEHYTVVFNSIKWGYELSCTKQGYEIVDGYHDKKGQKMRKMPKLSESDQHVLLA